MTAVSTNQSTIGAAGPRPKRYRASSESSRINTWMRSIWRRRWLALASAWVLCLVGWAIITLWPSHYVSSAVVYADLHRLIDQKSPTASLTTGHDAEQNPAALLTTILLSEDNLSTLRKTVKLDDQPASTLGEDITIRSTAPALFVTSYHHKDPAKAHLVLETLIATLGDQTEKKATETEASLKEEMAKLEKRIQAAEVNLALFEEINVAVVNEPSEETSDIAALERGASDLEQQIEEALAERDEIAQQLAQLPSEQQASETAAQGQTLSASETAELATLKARLTELRERYADTHPYVSQVIETIEAIETPAANNQAPTQTSSGKENQSIGDSKINDKLAELKKQHEEKIAEIARLNKELANKRREIDRLGTLTEDTSSVEAEQSRLEGAVEDLKATLVSLTARSEQVQRQDDEQIEHQAEQTEEAPFKLINGPNLPDKPTGPPRLLCLALVLLAGIGSGGAAAVLRNRSKRVFESAWQLKKRFDVGVLGTISEVLSPAERKQLGYSRLVFGLSCFALLGVFSGLAIAELMNLLTPWGDSLRIRLLG